MSKSLIAVSKNLATNLCKNLKSKLKQSNGFILKKFLNIHFLSNTLQYVICIRSIFSITILFKVLDVCISKMRAISSVTEEAWRKRHLAKWFFGLTSSNKNQVNWKNSFFCEFLQNSIEWNLWEYWDYSFLGWLCFHPIWWGAYRGVSSHLTCT